MYKISSSVLKTSIKRTLYTLATDLSKSKQKEISILVAISGGQDSTCLTMFLMIYKKLINSEKNIRIGLIHCQHNWSLQSLEMSTHLDSWILELRKLGIDVTLYSSIPSFPVLSEASSRKWRLKLFNRIANRNKYQVILTGHNLNDQIETFLMQQIIRGFFKPIKNFASREISRLKPLSWINRYEIWKICSYWQFPIFCDSNNESFSLTRSRIRVELISILKTLYNPQVENSLIQSIETKKEEKLCQSKIFPIVFFEDQILLNRLTLKKLPKLVQQNVWRQCFQILGIFNLGFFGVEKCILYSQIKTEFKFYLLKSVVLKGNSNWLVLSKNQNKL